MHLLSTIKPICPFCNGNGGAMSGYWQPEFDACECCNPNDDHEEEIVRVWRWRIWLHRFEIWRENRIFDRMIRDYDTD
jgi:hypothetical protein